jgi:hypothetical protein
MKKTGECGLVVIVSALLLLCWGCAVQPPSPVYTKGEKEYGKVRGALGTGGGTTMRGVSRMQKENFIAKLSLI